VGQLLGGKTKHWRKKFQRRQISCVGKPIRKGGNKSADPPDQLQQPGLWDEERKRVRGEPPQFEDEMILGNVEQENQKAGTAQEARGENEKGKEGTHVRGWKDPVSSEKLFPGQSSSQEMKAKSSSPCP